MYKPDTTFIEATIPPTLLSKLTVFLFLTILVTLSSIILLSPVAAVIPRFFNQIFQKNSGFFKEIYGFLHHPIVYFDPVSTALFISKAAGCSTSVIAVEELSGLKRFLKRNSDNFSPLSLSFSMFLGLQVNHSSLASCFLQSSH